MTKRRPSSWDTSSIRVWARWLSSCHSGVTTQAIGGLEKCFLWRKTCEVLERFFFDWSEADYMFYQQEKIKRSIVGFDRTRLRCHRGEVNPLELCKNRWKQGRRDNQGGKSDWLLTAAKSFCCFKYTLLQLACNQRGWWVGAIFVLRLEPKRCVVCCSVQSCCKYESFVGTSNVDGVRCIALVGLEVHLHLRNFFADDDYYFAEAASSSSQRLHALYNA